MRIGLVHLLVFLLAASSALGAEIDADKVAFFESRIRPVLVAECYDCHGPEKQKGGLRVDYRGGLLEGGSEGPSVKSGDPGGSLLLKTLRHEVDGLEMPRDGAPLTGAVIRDFEKWIRDGAVDPRDKPAVPSAVDAWESAMKFRSQWWSFQRIKNEVLPEMMDKDWSHPVDRFLYRGMKEKGLQPAGVADRGVLFRRLYYALTGLPPSGVQVELFLSKGDRSIASVVDELMRTPAFAERWARHWMDWVRYAESHGSEGDAPVPYPHEYRDYMIRAIDNDVPVSQLIREHIAGDLLDEPRLNQDGTINESRLGLGHYRMVQHGFQPTDALDELVRFTDDQIDVVSKAFLGLTVSCARCHNHKFDPISHEDYYSFFGVMRSSLPGVVQATPEAMLTKHNDRLGELKEEIRKSMAVQWIEDQKSQPIPQKLFPDVLRKMISMGVEERRKERTRYVGSWKENNEGVTDRWDLRSEDYNEWMRSGVAWNDEPFSAGDFKVSGIGKDHVIDAIYPAGAWTHSVSSKHGGVLSSPRFSVGKGQVHVKLIGGDFAQARLAIQSFPIPRHGIYGMKSQPETDVFQWSRWNTDYWEGEEAHVELATFDDLAFFHQLDRKRNPDRADGRSYIGIQEVVVHDGSWKPDSRDPVVLAFLEYWTGKGELEEALNRWTATQLKGWSDASISDAGAIWLNRLLKAGVLKNDSSMVNQLLVEYRKQEDVVPVAVRGGGVLETKGKDQRLFVRGDHRQPAQVVPRRFLEVIDDRPFETSGSGRLELADAILSPSNPLTARVMVNRIWTRIFGKGLVDSVDNFGRLGQSPSHPELLDWLATEFQKEGWSLKKLVRLLVTSRAFRLSADASDKAKELDPGNRLLSHHSIRRLDAESIRDSLLKISGRLDQRLYGPSVNGGMPRRSLYVRAKRNSLDPFLTTFDMPEPLSTRGKRNETNVPAQSLTLMNDPMVRSSSAAWAGKILSDSAQDTVPKRLRAMYLAALGRVPEEREIEALSGYIRELQSEAARITEKRDALRKDSEKIRIQLGRLSETAMSRFEESDSPEVPVPQAILEWTFQDGEVQGSGLSLKGDAKIEGDTLVLSGKGFAQSESLPTTLVEKTLAAEVRLTNLSQRAGGVVSVQTSNGRVFDAIVYAEREPGKWMAGSDNGKRTQNVQGERERDAINQFVHLALTYASDGTVQLFRNGAPYGRSYEADGPIHFEAGEAVVTLGLRHLPGTGNRYLTGVLKTAAVYDRVLSQDEIEALVDPSSRVVSEKMLLARLSAGELERWQRLMDRQVQVQSELRLLSQSGDLDEKSRWAHVAHTMFNLKEFLFVR